MYGRFDWRRVCAPHLCSGFGGWKRAWDSLELELEMVVRVDAETRTWALGKSSSAHDCGANNSPASIVSSITLLYPLLSSMLEFECLPKVYVWRLGPKPVRVWVPVEVKSWRACCWRSIETLIFLLFLSCVSWAPWSEQVAFIICSHHNKLVHPGPGTETSQ